MRNEQRGSQPRPTKRERREQRRAEVHAQQQKQAQDKRNRNFAIGGGLAAAAVGVIGLGIHYGVIFGGNSAPSDPTPVSGPISALDQDYDTPYSYEVNKAFVLNTVTRAEPSIALQERSLWQQYEVDHKSVKLPPQFNKEEVHQEVMVRFNKVLNIMKTSNNPYFREAGEFFRRELNNTIAAQLFLDTRSSAPLMALGSGKAPDGSVVRILRTEVSEIMRNNHPVDWAIAFTHEYRHEIQHRERKEQAKKAAQASGREFSESDFFDQEQSNTNQFLLDEADAYAHETEALLEQTKYGFNGSEDALKRARKYIEYGKNPTDPRWVSFIKRNIASAAAR